MPSLADTQQQGSGPSRRCLHSLPPGSGFPTSPRNLPRRRTLVPMSCSSRMGANMLPLPFPLEASPLEWAGWIAWPFPLALELPK